MKERPQYSDALDELRKTLESYDHDLWDDLWDDRGKKVIDAITNHHMRQSELERVIDSIDKELGQGKEFMDVWPQLSDYVRQLDGIRNELEKVAKEYEFDELSLLKYMAIISLKHVIPLEKRRIAVFGSNKIEEEIAKFYNDFLDTLHTEHSLQESKEHLDRAEKYYEDWKETFGDRASDLDDRLRSAINKAKEKWENKRKSLDDFVKKERKYWIEWARKLSQDNSPLAALEAIFWAEQVISQYGASETTNLDQVSTETNYRGTENVSLSMTTGLSGKAKNDIDRLIEEIREQIRNFGNDVRNFVLARLFLDAAHIIIKDMSANMATVGMADSLNSHAESYVSKIGNKKMKESIHGELKKISTLVQEKKKELGDEKEKYRRLWEDLQDFGKEAQQREGIELEEFVKIAEDRVLKCVSAFRLFQGELPFTLTDLYEKEREIGKWKEAMKRADELEKRWRTWSFSGMPTIDILHMYELIHQTDKFMNEYGNTKVATKIVNTIENKLGSMRINELMYSRYHLELALYISEKYTKEWRVRTT